MGLVHDVAEEALDVSYEAVPEDEIHQVKRLLLDSLACALGGGKNATVEALLRTTPMLGGASESTVLTGSAPTSALNALLVNGAMLRYLDMNDVQSSDVSPKFRGGHNSELFPAVLAIAERQGLSGRDVILASWLGYELSTRLMESITGRTLEERGWNMDLRASFVTPIVAGLLLGLDATEIEHAVGIALSRGTLLEVIDHPAEVNSMAKNLRYPLGAHLGVMATYLASQGLTGPMRALEGGMGFIETVLGGDFDVDHMRNAGWRGRVKLASMKRFAACFAQHGHLSATLNLLREHDIVAADVEAIDIRTTTRGAWHTGDESRRHPTNKETADHSSFFVQAALVVDRELGPMQYVPEKLADEEVRRIATRVSIRGDAAFDDVYPSAAVTIRLKGGAVHESYVGHPPGSPANPLSDHDIEEKFRSLARGSLSGEDMEACIAAVWKLDEYHDVGEFMAQMANVAGQREPV